MTISTLLRDSDPIVREGSWTPEQRAAARQLALRSVGERQRAPSRTLIFAAAVALMLVAISVGARFISQSTDALMAAVRFEVHIAENQAAPGLREATVKDTGRKIYLHPEPILTNADIANAKVVDSGTSTPSIGLTFTTAGAAKLMEATRQHIGSPIAILLDGEVVMAPTVRSAIGPAANINGTFTAADLTRIVNGIIGK